MVTQKKSRKSGNSVIQLRLGSYDDARVWRSAAAREHVSLTDKPGAIWYIAADGGCVCVYPIRPGRYRVRAVYVPLENRGRGVGTALGERAIREAERLGALSVDAFALNPQWYVDRGFVIVGSNPFGAVHVRKEIART